MIVAFSRQELRELLGRIDNRHEPPIGHMLPAKSRLFIEVRNIAMHLGDDVLRSAGRHDQCKIRTRHAVRIAKLRQRRRVREQGRTLSGIDGERDHFSLSHIWREIRAADEGDRGDARKNARENVSAALERNGDQIGAVLLVEPFEEQALEDARHDIIQCPRLCLRERGEFVQALTLSDALATMTCVLKNRFMIGLKGLSRIRKLLVEKFVRHEPLIGKDAEGVAIRRRRGARPVADDGVPAGVRLNNEALTPALLKSFPRARTKIS